MAHHATTPEPRPPAAAISHRAGTARADAPTGRGGPPAGSGARKSSTPCSSGGRPVATLVQSSGDSRGASGRVSPAELINIAADFYFKIAERQLSRRGLSPSKYLGQMPETVVVRAMGMLPRIRSGELETSAFLDIFGHRAPQDYELASPRYNEDPKLIEKLLSRASSDC